MNSTPSSIRNLRMNVLGLGGNTDPGAVFPSLATCVSLPNRAAGQRRRELRRFTMFLVVCDFAPLHQAALCAARVALSAAVGSSDGGIWGVSDPLCHPLIPVPRLSPRGSLTPQMRVTVVRQNRALSLTSPSAPPVSRAVPALFPSSMSTSDSFDRKVRSYG
jgi:hypothetical protein